MVCRHIQIEGSNNAEEHKLLVNRMNQQLSIWFLFRQG